ncbi:MAG TPA: fibronectin type III domain-containing protein [Chthoniobacterales bacterium]|jgi:hypothetical protein
MIVKPSVRYLIKASDADVIVRARVGLAGIGRNPAIFIQPSPTLAAVPQALEAFIAALQESARGGPAQTAIKNGERAKLVRLMRLLADYVCAVANGDMGVLLLSGLPHQQPTRSRIGALRRPAVPQVKHGPKSGSLLAATAPVYGARSHNWRVALASNPIVYVQTAQTLGGRVQFGGLIAGEVYNVEVSAVGAAGVSDWSEAGTTRIL